jgi:hypothetical protein
MAVKHSDHVRGGSSGGSVTRAIGGYSMQKRLQHLHALVDMLGPSSQRLAAFAQQAPAGRLPVLEWLK